MALKVKTNDKAVKSLEVLIKQAGKYQTKIGWFKEDVYPNGQPVAYIASIQEEGFPANNIPPRPFLRPGLAKSKNEVIKIVANESKKIVEGNSSIEKMMNIIGATVQKAIFHEISTLTEPPLKEATVKARARKYASQKGKITSSLEKPLIDTHKMIDSLKFVVEEK